VLLKLADLLFQFVLLVDLMERGLAVTIVAFFAALIIFNGLWTASVTSALTQATGLTELLVDTRYPGYELQLSSLRALTLIDTNTFVLKQLQYCERHHFQYRHRCLLHLHHLYRPTSTGNQHGDFSTRLVRTRSEHHQQSSGDRSHSSCFQLSPHILQVECIRSSCHKSRSVPPLLPDRGKDPEP